MKKLMIGISTVAVIGIGGILTVGQLNDDEPKQTAIASSETGNTETVKDVVEIPTERTTAIPGMPWEYYGHKNIIELQEEGEVVYLFSDAETIENRMIEIAGVDESEFEDAPEGYTKKEMAETSADSLQLFISEVSKYVDNQAYFDKLTEVKQSLLNGEYDQIPTLIEEAKTLRES